MNLVLLFDDDFIAPGRARLYGRRQQHIESVLGASNHDSVRVGLLGGRMGTGTIVSAGHGLVELEIELDEDPPAAAPLTLLLALPRPKVLSRVLRTITVLGVKQIVLFDCWRVEKSFWSSPRLDPERVREDLLEGLEQARDTIVPEVRLVRRFRPFVEDELPSMVADRDAWIAHPGAGEFPRDHGKEPVVAIGPEGGFIPNEIELFQRAGFRPVSVGPRILHIEAAVPSLIARFL